MRPSVATVAAVKPLAVTAVVPASNRHTSYQPCIPNGPDLDCPDIGHRVRIAGPDEYRLNADPDEDDISCDGYPEPPS